MKSDGFFKYLRVRLFTYCMVAILLIVGFTIVDSTSETPIPILLGILGLVILVGTDFIPWLKVRVKSSKSNSDKDLD